MRAPAQQGEGGRIDASSSVSPATLHIRLLGELEVQAAAERLAPFESARARSLLGYLLLNGDGPHSRQRLAFVLWPDSTEAQARTNLRKVLHTLRHEAPELESYLHVTPRTLQWRWDQPAWIDVVAFEAALSHAEQPGIPRDETVDWLRDAVALYRGDVLEGCYDEWLLDERARLRDRYASALRRLAQRLADRGDHAEAIRYGRELLRCDPLQEDTYRLLMHVHAAIGDRAGALRVYHECVATLHREIGVAPSAETDEMRAALMQSRRTDASDATTAGPDGRPDNRARRSTDLETAPVSRSARTPVRRYGDDLVGREIEWRGLTDMWLEAGTGPPRMVVVTGESGIGKTRLVEELSAWCAHRGAIVAQARSYPTGGELGYGVVISWLRNADVAGRLHAAPSAARLALARLLPELDAGGQPPAERLDPAEQRQRLFDAVTAALTGSTRPVLLVADDAQWCDAQSLALMHYLVRSDLIGHVLMVAAVRREELDDQHPLTDTFENLRAIDRASEIALARLSRQETETLARRLVAEVPPDRDLHTETEGNPLFIVEAVRAIREGGAERWALTPKLQAVIGARLRRCAGATAEVLGIAATVGREFTADLVSAAYGRDDAAFARAIDELWRRGVVRAHGHDGYDFSHGSIRDVAYQRLSPATRRRNHVLVAEALRRLHARDLDSVSGHVARHYDRAGRFPAALDWYRRAAVEAQRRHADVEAVALLERARELLPMLPEASRLATELAIVSALPTALVGVDGFASDRVAEVQARAVEVADRIGAELAPPLLRSLVMSRLCRHDFEGARAAAGRLRASAERSGDAGLLVESGYLLGIAAFWASRLDAARAHFAQVVESFQPRDRDEHLLRFGHDPAIVCLSRLGNTLWFLGRIDEARQARDRATEMAIELGHPYTRSTAHGFAALLSIDLGDETAARRHVAALTEAKHHARPTAAFTEVLAGYIEVLDERPDPGIQRIEAAIAACAPIDPAPGVHAGFRRVLLAAHDAAGDAARGLTAADEALQLSGSRLWEAEIRRLRAHFLAATEGPQGEVAAELSRAATVARRQGAHGLGRRVEETRARLGSAG